MAKIVSTQQIMCPKCNAVGIVRIWSCGCQDISHGGHNSNCQYQDDEFFKSFESYCGSPWDLSDPAH